MQINKIKLVGSIPEEKGNPEYNEYYLMGFDCDVYMNDEMVSNVSSLKIEAKPGREKVKVTLELLVNELEVELNGVETEISQVVPKEGEQSYVIGKRLPIRN